MAGNLKASELRSMLRRLDSANQALETCIQSLGECEKTLQKSIQCQNYLNHCTMEQCYLILHNALYEQDLALAWSPTDLTGTLCWLIDLSMQSNLLDQNLSLFVCDRGINSLQMILQALTGRKWDLISAEDSQSKWQVPSSTLKSIPFLTVEEFITGISQPNFICLNLPISKMDGGSIQPIEAGFVPNGKARTLSGHAAV